MKKKEARKRNEETMSVRGATNKIIWTLKGRSCITDFTNGTIRGDPREKFC